MPVYKKKSGKWGITNVNADYDSKEKANSALRAIKAEQARRAKKGKR